MGPIRNIYSWPLAAILLSAWYSAAVAAEIVREERAVSGFAAVVVSGTGVIELTQGRGESLVIEADSDVLDAITTRVEDGVLHIGRKSWSWFNFGPTKPVVYHLHFKTLDSLSLSGSVKAVADTVSSHRLRIKVSGSGSLVFEELHATELTATVSGSGSVHVKSLEADEFDGRISGSGSITIGGQVSRQHIRISGSGDYLAANLEGDAVDAWITGSGRAHVWANEELDVRISGSGGLRYRGEPSLSERLSGSGRIRRSD